MKEYLKSSHAYRSIEIDRSVGTVTKVWKPAWVDAWNKQWETSITLVQWLQQHVAMLDAVAPNRVIEFGERGDSVYIVFKYVAGLTLEEWTIANYKDDPTLVTNVWEQAVKFWIDGALESFPYSHWDWSPCNTIIVQQDPFQFCMIDWDVCRIASHNETKDRLIQCMDYAQAKTTNKAPQVGFIFEAASAAVSTYFDSTVHKNMV